MVVVFVYLWGLACETLVGRLAQIGIEVSTQERVEFGAMWQLWNVACWVRLPATRYRVAFCSFEDATRHNVNRRPSVTKWEDVLARYDKAAHGFRNETNRQTEN